MTGLKTSAANGDVFRILDWSFYVICNKDIDL